MGMIILTGISGSGKTTVAKILQDHGYKRVVTYTTRPLRTEDGEKDGVDYHFISEEKFLALKAKNFFAETAEYNASFGHCFYGSARIDYTDGDKVIVLNPFGVKAIRENGIPGDIFWLDMPEEICRKRLLARGDDPAEVARRAITDREDFAGMADLCDYRIHLDEKVKPEEIASFIAATV